jgi:hypothetical protein
MKCWAFKILTYQVAAPFIKYYVVQIYYFLPNFLYCVLYAGLSLLSVSYQFTTIINPLNRSSAVPEKISFSGRQKSVGKQTSFFAIFGLRVCLWKL